MARLPAEFADRLLAGHAVAVRKAKRPLPVFAGDVIGADMLDLAIGPAKGLRDLTGKIASRDTFDANPDIALTAFAVFKHQPIKIGQIIGMDQRPDDFIPRPIANNPNAVFIARPAGHVMKRPARQGRAGARRRIGAIDGGGMDHHAMQGRIGQDFGEPCDHPFKTRHRGKGRFFIMDGVRRFHRGVKPASASIDEAWQGGGLWPGLAMQNVQQFDQHPGINRAHIGGKITCGMDDGIDNGQFIAPRAGIVNVAADRPCAHDGKMGGTVFVACQGKDMMPGRNQIAHNRRPDQAASAQNKNTHRHSPEFVMRLFIEPQVRVRSRGKFGCG